MPNPESATGPIVIATPHARYRGVVEAVRTGLPGREVRWVADPAALTGEAMAGLAPDWVFFPHWSWKIPESLYGTHRCVIFHMTDLPYGRGGSPLQNLIVRGHQETRLSALRCVAELDAGPIYLKRPLGLEGTAEEILCRAAGLMPGMICEIVEQNLEPRPQQGDPVAFVRRKPEDGNLASLEDPQRIYDHIRMLDGEGYPPAFLEAGSLRVEFTEAQWAGDLVTAKATLRVRS